ncbi:ABC transporter ATP-binding protein [Fodinisporobacter ferrooxydans]|uniref:ABC transporter ATP-binding protein n=1 Tax=Fodinisporobacter ferrooxydans TaxID=2901836 RepID=A0ABY4CJN6_9BACL|nr:ABC transporter ATP-binding protein [Alicyclobacillaceae bacterium MYW30-H2]
MDLAIMKKQDASTNVLIHEVTKTFGDATVVNNITLGIEKGEFMTLLGPSGCGKTTLLSMILGILDVTTGSISFNSQRIDYIPMHKRDVGMVFQNYALFPHMTVMKNVEFGLEMRKIPKGERKRRALEALEMVQLEHLANRYPKELSGGQQQRVALARALVVQPKVLLLDEPLSNLDAKLRKDMRLQLKKLHQELGITTIYVTHDQEEALSLSTKVAVMAAGKLQQVGTPREIFLKPKNQFVADFIGYGNFFKGRLTGEQAGNFIFQSEKGFTLEVRKDTQHKLGDSVILTIKPENIRIINQKTGRNELSGNIVISDYVGNITGYEILSEYGDPLKLNALGADSFPVGSELMLYFDPEHLVMID